jgi:capsular polysaccharide biosynthesis protein
MNENKSEKKELYEIDALQILKMLLKRWWVIAISAVLCAVAIFAYTQSTTVETYRSTSTLLINGDSSISSAYQQILAGQYQSNDYPYILKANDTLNDVVKYLDEYDFEENGGVPYRTYTASVLSGMVSFEVIDDSRIFRITVTSVDPEESRVVAEAVSKVFVERAEYITSADVAIVDSPISGSAVSAGYGRKTTFGFLIGLVIGAALVIVPGLMNDTIDSDEWLQTQFKDEIPVLSTVPDAYSDNKSYRSYGYYRSSKKTDGENK